MRCRALPAAAALAAALSGVAWGAGADYRPENGGWNGLSSLCALARGMGLEPLAVSTLAWGDLRPTDVLWLIYPRGHLDGDRLLEFVRAGGRAVLADDFGDGEAAFAAFGLRRVIPDLESVAAYRGHAQLAIARALDASSPLAQGVGDLVANHPAAFALPLGAAPGDARVIFAFDGQAALVVDERVGAGRLVAVADPSLLINEMQAIPGDAAFATDLLRELAPPPSASQPAASGAAGPRLLLAIEGFAAEGEPSVTRLAPAGPLGDRSGTAGMALAFNRWLDGLGDYVARERWLLALALALAAAGAFAVPRVLRWGRASQAATWALASPAPRPTQADLLSLRGRPTDGAAAGLLVAELERRLGELGVDAAALRGSEGAARAEQAASRAAGDGAGSLARDLVARLYGRGARPLSARQLDRALGLAQNLFTMLDLGGGPSSASERA